MLRFAFIERHMYHVYGGSYLSWPEWRVPIESRPLRDHKIITKSEAFIQSHHTHLDTTNQKQTQKQRATTTTANQSIIMNRRSGMLRQLSQFSMRRLGVSRRNLNVVDDSDNEDPAMEEKPWVPAPKGIADCKLQHNNHHAELGRVRFRFTGEEYDKALEYSRDTDKPLLVIFQEIPGCPESVAFGQTVLSHPLLVEAAETLFCPLIVNTAGDDQLLLVAKYKELRHHSTMVRILNDKGTDLTLSLEDDRCTIGNIAKAMRMALNAKVLKVPSYLRILETEYVAQEEDHHGGKKCWARTMAFRVVADENSLALAETHFAELKGVLGTETGKIGHRHNNNNVIKVTYNSHVIDCKAVVRQALFHNPDDVTAVYYGDKMSTFLPIQTEFDKLDDATQPLLEQFDARKFRSDVMQKKQFLQRTLYRYVPLTTLQLTMVNFALSRGNMDANAVLSPRQLAILEAVETKHPRKNVVNVDISKAWAKLENDGVYDWM